MDDNVPSRYPGLLRSDKITTDIVGPICESGDFLARDRDIAAVKAGDLLAVGAAGAYCFTMASNYNTRPRAAEVLVKGDQYAIIRRRETVEELIAPESIPAFLQPGCRSIHVVIRSTAGDVVVHFPFSATPTALEKCKMENGRQRPQPLPSRYSGLLRSTIKYQRCLRKWILDNKPLRKGATRDKNMMPR